MGFHYEPRWVHINFYDVTPQLNAIYGLEYSVTIYRMCAGSPSLVWQSGLLAEYSDWGGGVIFQDTFGVDPNSNWWVNVHPIGNGNCALANGTPCEVRASSIYRQHNFNQQYSVIEIPWSIRVLS